jgi:hypothetical protein
VYQVLDLRITDSFSQMWVCIVTLDLLGVFMQARNILLKSSGGDGRGFVAKVSGEQMPLGGGWDYGMWSGMWSALAPLRNASGVL